MSAQFQTDSKAALAQRQEDHRADPIFEGEFELYDVGPDEKEEEDYADGIEDPEDLK